MVMFGAVDDLLSATGIRPKDIGILIVNCGVLNTTPSLSAMLINHYKLKHNVQSFNLGGMGCAAGLVAIDLARDLLSAYPGSYALVVSTEVVSFTWYGGNELDMLLPNCFFRMGAAAVLLSNRLLDRWRAKYQLKQVNLVPFCLTCLNYNILGVGVMNQPNSTQHVIIATIVTHNITRIGNRL